MMVVAPSPTASPNEEQKPDQHREDYLMSLDRQQAGAHERVSTSEMAPNPDPTLTLTLTVTVTVTVPLALTLYLLYLR